MKRIALAVIGLALVVGSITGCDALNADANGRGDAPVGPVDKSGAEILNFPDTYGNVATKCDGHGHRVFVNTRGDTTGSELVIIADKSCAGGEAQ